MRGFEKKVQVEPSSGAAVVRRIGMEMTH